MRSSQHHATPRSVVLVSPDNDVRSRLSNLLTGMRWRVQEASGGAEAMAFMDEQLPEAVMVDSWLPDLEVSAFSEHLRQLYPEVDLLSLDGAHGQNANRSPRRNELLHALREIQESDVADNPHQSFKLSTYATTAQKTNLKVAQASLVSADTAELATEFSATETQRTALMSVISVVQKGSLFDYL